MKRAGAANQRSRVKCPQVKRGVVQNFLGLRVSREQHLESTIQLKTVHIVSPHPPANSVRCFEDTDIQPTGGQSPRNSTPRGQRR